MSDDEEICNIVIDNGSFNCMAGFAGDDAPRSLFPSVVGTPRYRSRMVGLDYLDSYVGDRAQAKRGILTSQRPIQNGVVQHWDDMEEVWRFIFENELHVNPVDRGVLISEPVLNPKYNREKMMEVMLETFQAAGFYVGTDGNLAIYASGRGTAISIGVGHDIIQAYPVYEGYTFKAAHTRSPLGGSDVTNHLRKLMQQRGCRFTDPIEEDMCNKMKPSVCYVAKDFEEEMRICECFSTNDASFELPDGNTIRVGSERSQAAEVLFNPSLVGKEVMALQDVVQTCLSNCDVDARRDFHCNFVLYGGSSMFPGIAERLTKELKKVLPPNRVVKVISPPERKFSVWIGGSILASLSTFNTWWITKQQYEEEGLPIVHRKCIS